MPDLAWWLQHFERSAFRLEGLPAYSMPQETAMLAAFRRGEAVVLPADHPWITRVREKCGAGRKMERVRLVSSPPTDYERFELSLYPHSRAAGENIRVVERGSVEVAEDFWLFDDAVAVVLRYDAGGRFLGADVTSDVVRFRRQRELVLARSMSLEEYQARR
jgi:hypothetical protein